MRTQIENLIASTPYLWRGDQMSRSFRGISTGIAEFDDVLPAHGWPVGAVVELSVPFEGIGELQLLLPAIRHVTSMEQYAVVISPPYNPNAAALLSAGINLDKLLFIQASSRKDILWAAEKTLRNSQSGMVLIWAGYCLDDDTTRRLQVAAKDGDSILFVYRRGRPVQSNWVALRIELTPASSSLQINVLKITGTHRRPRLCVDLEKDR